MAPQPPLTVGYFAIAHCFVVAGSTYTLICQPRFSVRLFSLVPHFPAALIVRLAARSPVVAVPKFPIEMICACPFATPPPAVINRGNFLTDPKFRRLTRPKLQRMVNGPRAQTRS
jgi:hypothetical protein